MSFTNQKYFALYKLYQLLYDKHLSEDNFYNLLDLCFKLLKINSINFKEDTFLDDNNYKGLTLFTRHLYLYKKMLNSINTSNIQLNNESFATEQKLYSLLILLGLINTQNNSNVLELNLALGSLRLSGVRNFLHPHKSNCSPLSLAGRYCLIYWTMRSISLSFLFLTNNLPLCELAVTLARATLIINTPNIVDLNNTINYLDNYVKSIHPCLGIEFIQEPISLKNIFNGLLNLKTYNCNSSANSKTAEKRDFYYNNLDQTYDLEKSSKDLERVFIDHMNTSEMFIIVELAEKNKLGGALPVTYTSENNIQKVIKKHFTIRIKIQDLFPTQIPLNIKHFAYNHLNNLLQHNKANNPGVLRIDVSSFLEKMANYSDGVLYKQQIYRLLHQKFFIIEIPNIVKKINENLDLDEYILIMHSILDDCICFGNKKDLKLLSELLNDIYQKNWDGALKFAFAELEQNSTAADMSYKALVQL